MNDDLHKTGMRFKFIYSLVGLVLGLACILAGVVLGLAGVTGNTSWTASVMGMSSDLNDAGPGVVVFIVGIFMVWITRFSVSDRIESAEGAKGAGGGASGGGGGSGSSGGGGFSRRHIKYRK